MCVGLVVHSEVETRQQRNQVAICNRVHRYSLRYCWCRSSTRPFSFHHFLVTEAMANASLDSVAAFAERAQQIGVSQEMLQYLKASGFDTYGKLGFAVTHSPQSNDDTAFQQFVQDVWQGADEIPRNQVAAMRRLFFESHTLALSEIRFRVETTSDATTPSRRMPTAERLSRQQEQEARLVGIIFTPETTPANHLVDMCVEMLECGVLQYIKPDQCCSRAHEVMAVKKDQALSLDPSGAIKVGSKQSETACDTSSELKLRAALQRRSLAMDLAGLASFTVIESWVQFLFTKLLQEQPKGFQKIALSQLLDCDRQMFTLASHKTMGKLAGEPNKTKPLDVTIEELKVSQEVLQYLSPIPAGRSSQPEPPSKKPKTDHPQGGNAPKGPGPSRPKQTSSKVQIPADCTTHDADNKPLCFGFQYGKCKWRGEAGKRCARGFHKCFKKGCFRNKPYHLCTHSD